ncbi:hypothetical protein Thiowin_00136 [Thiorhodovibrio winogradskyi]|uniref:Uncharacterized protein n=1 Tax=Thiorhodovibrio winogradskyi TaxID=77007 RepID=A0ABZ0S4W1_9GAMM|nr:ribbon-helix-helix protein, CopG family [Thiorhodovibrio winogradskyi]
MTTLTIRLPDDTAARLDSLARSRGLTTDKLGSLTFGMGNRFFTQQVKPKGWHTLLHQRDKRAGG